MSYLHAIDTVATRPVLMTLTFSLKSEPGWRGRIHRQVIQAPCRLEDVDEVHLSLWTGNPVLPQSEEWGLCGRLELETPADVTEPAMPSQSSSRVTGSGTWLASEDRPNLFRRLANWFRGLGFYGLLLLASGCGDMANYDTKGSWTVTAYPEGGYEPVEWEGARILAEHPIRNQITFDLPDRRRVRLRCQYILVREPCGGGSARPEND